jgi:hypothetical protein
MSSTGPSNKNWLYAALGGLALVGAAVIFHHLTSAKAEGDDSSAVQLKVIEEIDALGKP